MGLACENKSGEEVKKKNKKPTQGLNKFSPALRKEDNCIMLNHGWRLFFVSPKGREAAPLGAPVWAGANCSSPLEGPLGKQSHGTPLAALELCLRSPQPSWLPWSSACCSCQGNCSKALNCHALAWKLFAIWSPAVPTGLSAVFLRLNLTTTVVLMYDEGKVGVNCQLRAERGSSLAQLMGKSEQSYVWTLNIIPGWKLFL